MKALIWRDDAGVWHATPPETGPLDICCHGVEWVRCGCKDCACDDDMAAPLADDECPWCGDVHYVEANCMPALLAGGAQADEEPPRRPYGPKWRPMP